MALRVVRVHRSRGWEPPRHALTRAIGALERPEAPLGLARDEAPEVFEAADRLEVGYPSMSKKMSPSDGAGNRPKPRPVRAQAAGSGARRPRLHLEPRLARRTIERLRHDADTLRCGVEHGQLFNGCDAHRVEPVHLVPPHPRHQAQMVIVFALVRAV